MQEADTNADGTISFEEFVNIVKKVSSFTDVCEACVTVVQNRRHMTENDLHDVFDYLDETMNGFLSPSALCDADSAC
jgi:Ca2+-binding EF-hand superfamily protein